MRHKSASCRSCGGAFAPGAARVAPGGAQARQCKHFHPHCVPNGLGLLADIVGVSELPSEARQQVEEFADGPGRNRAEYMESKKRRGEKTGVGGRHVELPGDGLEAIAGVQPDQDGAFEDDALLNLPWFDHMKYSEAHLECVPTVSGVPEPLQMACADARAAVLLALEAAPPESPERLLKLFTYMDRSLFAAAAPTG